MPLFEKLRWPRTLVAMVGVAAVAAGWWVGSKPAEGLVEPALSRDVLFSTFDMQDDADIAVAERDGTGVRRLTTSEWGEYSPAWSPDEQHIVYAVNEHGTDANLYVMEADGSNPRRITSGPD